MKRVMAFALAASMFAAVSVFAQVDPSQPSQPQVQQPAEGGVDWSGVGYGAAAVAADIFYVPAKFVYATLGGITGGASYALTGGNAQTSDTIWRSSPGGDYVLTPKMIKGEEPIHFSGPAETPPASTANASGPTDAGMMANPPAEATAGGPRRRGLPIE